MAEDENAPNDDAFAATIEELRKGHESAVLIEGAPEGIAFTPVSNSVKSRRAFHEFAKRVVEANGQGLKVRKKRREGTTRYKFIDRLVVAPLD